MFASPRRLLAFLTTKSDRGFFHCQTLCKTRSKMQVDPESQGYVVMVTGGSGFLGQHIVKLLQEKRSTLDVKEIRIFDTKLYQNKLDHPQVIPQKSLLGDVRHKSTLLEACSDVNVIIHVAGLISFGTNPDYQAMQKINVDGTQNVIESCIQNNIGHLVFTSTVDVVIGDYDIINGDETMATPDKFLFPGYPETKQKAEQLVLKANGANLSNGKRLSTISLRPNVMYGEQDPYYVTNALKTAKHHGNTLIVVGNGQAKFQQSYVGNVAWGHIRAMDTLASPRPTNKGGVTPRSEVVGQGGVTPRSEVVGQAYFVPDDTPLMNSFQFMKPFLASHQMALSKWSVPYSMAYGIMYMVEWVIWLLRPLVQINLQTPLCSIIYINRNIYFSGKKASELLGYQPLYSHKEGINASLNYYKNLHL